MESIERCPHCEEKERQEAENEHFNFAVLVSMVPLLVLTLFGQMGLF